ncbi:MAG TPA: HigA family addiction module antitoxin [Cytophagales bacterium]|nr:HigA family addiction module antitoxin [Cytophagales bacterium]
MIINFKHKGLKLFFTKGDGSKLPAKYLSRIEEMLFVLDNASELNDIDVPSFKLHPLKGDMLGLWSITVYKNYRIVFSFNNAKVEFMMLITLTTIKKLNTMIQHNPVHPGRILRLHVKATKKTIKEVAEGIGISRKVLSEILNEHAGVTAEMAVRFAKAFNTTPQFWVSMQSSFELSKAVKKVDTTNIVHFKEGKEVIPTN